MTEPSPELVEEIARVMWSANQNFNLDEGGQGVAFKPWEHATEQEMGRFDILARAVLSSPSIARALELTPQATDLSAIAQTRDLGFIYEDAKASVLIGEPCIEFSSDEIRATMPPSSRFFITVLDIVTALMAARASPPVERSEIGEVPVERAVND